MAAYTPPLYYEVNFDDDGLSYTPPAFNAVNFDGAEFLAWIPLMSLVPQ